MNSFLPLLISWLQLYGYPILWVTIFLASVGLPLPVGLVLLAAGAFAALGDFNIVLLSIIAISASVSGDSVGYVIGRRFGHAVLIWLKQERRFSLVSPQAVARSQAYFQQRGGWAIFLSRFLFSALGGTINLLSGAELYPYRRFLLYDTCGEAIGAVAPLTLGLIFYESWEAVGDILATISAFVMAFLITLYLALRLFRLLKRMKESNAGTDVVHLSGNTPASADGTQEEADLLPP